MLGPRIARAAAIPASSACDPRSARATVHRHAGIERDPRSEPWIERS